MSIKSIRQMRFSYKFESYIYLNDFKICNNNLSESHINQFPSKDGEKTCK